MYRYGFIFTTLLFIGSCKEPLGYHYDVYIDPNFSTAQIDQILLAETSWQSSITELSLTNTVGQCEGKHNGVACLHAVTQDQMIAASLACSNTEPPSGALGFTCYASDVDGGETYIAIDIVPPNLFQALLCHELGHNMGLKHTTNILDLMYPIIGAEQSPQPDDIQQFWSLR